MLKKYIEAVSKLRNKVASGLKSASQAYIVPVQNEILKRAMKEFDRPDTLLVLSSFPHQGEEIAVRNAISRYTYLLVKNMPKSQKVVVFCERNGQFKPYKLTPNILVVPTYRYHSFLFAKDVIGKVLQFKSAKNLLVQFEFSIFGGKIVVPQLVAALLLLKIAGVSTKIMVHQVVSDVNTLSGHLGVVKSSLKSKVLNSVIKNFYRSLGFVTDKVLVHDASLAKRMTKFVPAAKIEVIPHAIFRKETLTNKFSQGSKKLLGVPENYKTVTVFGYKSWYKGTDWIVKNFSKFIKNNPRLKIKLVIAGGDSPTLGGTVSYKKYSAGFDKIVKKANGGVLTTGFVPENDVKKVFAASDLVVFPYRTKMSASGAFSLVLGYGKKFLVSKPFSDNLRGSDFAMSMKENKLKLSDLTFDLNYYAFSEKLKSALNSQELDSKISKFSMDIVFNRTWDKVALKYQKVCLQGGEAPVKLGYGVVSYASAK